MYMELLLLRGYIEMPERMLKRDSIAWITMTLLILADNTATVHLVGCVINSRVVARDHAEIILEKCKVNGDVHATDSSTVRLLQTTIQGRIEMDPMAKVIRE